MEKKKEEVEAEGEKCEDNNFGFIVCLFFKYNLYQISPERYTPGATTRCSYILLFSNKAIQTLQGMKGRTTGD